MHETTRCATRVICLVGGSAGHAAPQIMKAVARREIDMVATWSVDRPGRSLTGLLELGRAAHLSRESQ